jgi:hypothetical protein
MLKFFRRIRRKLIDEGNLKRYLIYAIGEILLVMIGILLALQVNNWSENKKEKRLETDTLLEIRDALKEDLKSIEFVLNSHTKTLSSQNIVIEWIKTEKPYNDSLDFHFANSVKSTHALLRQGPYESLKDFGIRLIKNDSIRIQIQNLYDFTYE